MPRGGARVGAGRKKGGTNRRIMDWNGPLLIEPEKLKQLSPKAFLLEIMRDAAAPIGARVEAAKAVAPYVHARPKESESNQRDLLAPTEDVDDWGGDLAPTRPN